MALLGGDRPQWFLEDSDVMAVLLGFAAAWTVVRVGPDVPRSRARGVRLLGGVVLGGLWFLSPGLFITLVTVLVTAALLWLISRFVRGGPLVLGIFVLVGAAGLIGIAALTTRPARNAPREVPYASDAKLAPSAAMDRPRDATGNWVAQAAVGGVVEGVTQVALTLPSYARSVTSSRELVTRERPFRPTLYYVTSLMLWPLTLLWLAAAALLVWAQRGPIGEASSWVKARLQRGPSEGAPPPAVVP